jgi:succinoglycan biosynthesis protein ExoW
MSAIAVIIPYYQREPGLLRRALESVVAQEYQPAQVIVIDDGSPRRCWLDITDADFPHRLKGFTVILQKNKGVSAARNAGLASLFQDITAVAFLDSDDVWGPQHLKNAAEALAQGADFYFSNFRCEGESEDAFRDHASRKHLASTAEGLVTWTRGVSALMQSSCPFRTSSVVFRRSVMPNVRFPTKFRGAGEDHVVFWELVLRSSCVMYSPKVNLTYGNEGMGLWRNATLGTREHLRRLADEIRTHRWVLKHSPVQGENRYQIRRYIANNRGAALYSALHLIRRRHNVLWEILYLFYVDPACILAWSVDLPQRMVKFWRR